MMYRLYGRCMLYGLYGLYGLYISYLSRYYRPPTPPPGDSLSGRQVAFWGRTSAPRPAERAFGTFVFARAKLFIGGRRDTADASMADEERPAPSFRLARLEESVSAHTARGPTGSGDCRSEIFCL